MNNKGKVVNVPKDTEMVTLLIEKESGKSCTLREILPLVKGRVELVICDTFDKYEKDVDMFKLLCESGRDMLNSLCRSRIVDGDSILGLTPSIQRVDPLPYLANGTFQMRTEMGLTQLWVKPCCEEAHSTEC